MNAKEADKLMKSINSAKRQLQTEALAAVTIYQGSSRDLGSLWDIHNDIGSILDNVYQEVTEMLIVNGDLQAVQAFSRTQFKCSDYLKREQARITKESHDILFALEKAINEVEWGDDKQYRHISTLISRLRDQFVKSGTRLDLTLADNNKKLTEAFMEVLNGPRKVDSGGDAAEG